MGTILVRPRSNGTTAFMAKIILKRAGTVIHRESKTFERRAAAVAWIEKREGELARPGEIERANASKVTLADAIDKYTTDSAKEIGRTKAQVLKAIKSYSIAAKECHLIQSSDIVALSKELAKGRKPQTVANYLSHLAAVFAIAGPAWGYRLDAQAMKDAFTVGKRLGYTGKSQERDRRPTLDELETLLTHYQERHRRRPRSCPMHYVCAFALFSTRRQEELTRIRWEDLDVPGSRVMVRDMKNPGEKIGNNVWCDLPEPALRIIQAMPKKGERIFPYSARSISANFTRTCQLLGIEDLHFHDLRHDGVSRLFEIGTSIPRAAAVSGHRSWQTLQRYTHMRQAGDKYAGWKWLDVVSSPLAVSTSS
ncbi:site-specific integrase [Hyphomicrobium sp. 99]|uniref:site-specific integrase n=1 Tax=Hyphomicrobium sp. 99 TaxID=1163419 RepID=UPI0005F8034E|nr:site-specific integrase [Hyphomicrobium sp. 99]